MKTSKIYVGVNGAALSFGGGAAGLAVYPVQKGGKASFALLDTGKLGIIKGSRINGVGVARFLTDNGFQLAEPGNEAAAKLADILDVRDGTDLVAAKMAGYASLLQKQYGGQTCVFVPFDPEKAIRQVEVEANSISVLSCVDLVEQFNSARVKTVYKPGEGFSDVDLAKGWLVGLDVDVSTLPRLNEAMELAEHAVYVICNAGMGALVGAQNLVPDENMPADGLFYKGPLKVALTNGDHLLVGGTSDGLLATQYLRNDAVLYSRVGCASDMKLGPVIGDIAAVLVRVAEMDAQPVKKALKKAA